MEIDRLAPTRRPEGRAAGCQRWRHLAFVHWRVPVATLRPLVPEALEIDTFDGEAFVGIVPFTMLGVRPRWAPSVLGSAVTRRRWSRAFAVVIMAACAHANKPTPPSAPSAPDHDKATATNVPDNDHNAHRAPEADEKAQKRAQEKAEIKAQEEAEEKAHGIECKVWSPTDPACKYVCPNTGTELDLNDACQHCPKPPDPNLVVCQRTMPCPDPPDPRVRACHMPPSAQPPMVASSLVGQILAFDSTADGLIVVIGVGSNHGIDKSWSATVLVGDSDTPLAGGKVDLIRIDKVVSVGKVHLPIQQLASNSRVRLVGNQP